MGEAGHVFRTGERITVGQLQQLPVGILQQMIAVNHQKGQQKRYRSQHSLDDGCGVFHISRFRAAGVYTEQIPVVDPHRLQKEGILMPFITEGGEELLLIVQGGLYLSAGTL